MPSNQPQIKVYVSASQKEAEAQAIRKSGMSPSEFRREALRLMCAKFGVEFPSDDLQWGGDRRPETETITITANNSCELSRKISKLAPEWQPASKPIVNPDGTVQQDYRKIIG